MSHDPSSRSFMKVFNKTEPTTNRSDTSIGTTSFNTFLLIVALFLQSYSQFPIHMTLLISTDTILGSVANPSENEGGRGGNSEVHRKATRMGRKPISRMNRNQRFILENCMGRKSRNREVILNTMADLGIET